MCSSAEGKNSFKNIGLTGGVIMEAKIQTGVIGPEVVKKLVFVTMEVEEAKLLEELFSQFTYYTCISNTGFHPGGFDVPYDKVVTKLHSVLSTLLEKEEEV